MIAFVLGGGGLLGAVQVGMLRALAEAGVRPDLVLGSSVGALNGCAVAAEPDGGSLDRLEDAWRRLGSDAVFGGGLLGQLGTAARNRTALHGNGRLRALIEAQAPGLRFEDLAVPFGCVAACVETARAQWFDSGPVVDAVLASCAVPGLLPAVRIGERHYYDGGLVHSIPVGRAVELGADEVYVLQVGRVEQPLRAPRWPWEVASVAFEIARRHRFGEEMDRLPPGRRVHVLPAGDVAAPLANLRYRDTRQVPARIAAARDATRRYLDAADR